MDVQPRFGFAILLMYIIKGSAMGWNVVKSLF